jgi:hypothetical protein
MLALIQAPKKWDESYAPPDAKEKAEGCVESPYEVEPEFRALIDSLNCAKYMLRGRIPAYFKTRISRIRIESTTKARTSDELNNILDDLAALNNKENVDDYIFKPTKRAYRTAEFYVRKLYEKMGDAFPAPSFIPDGEGGVDIEWEVEGKELTLSCRAKSEQEDFLYVKKGNVPPYTELDLSSTKLYKHLQELINA